MNFDDQMGKWDRAKFALSANGYQRKPRHVAHASACAAQSKDCVTILSVARQVGSHDLPSTLLRKIAGVGFVALATKGSINIG